MILRRKFFVLMNDLTRYTVVLHGLKKNDFKDHILLLQEAIMITMNYDGFAQELVLKYVNGISEVTYGKTKKQEASISIE